MAVLGQVSVCLHSFSSTDEKMVVLGTASSLPGTTPLSSPLADFVPVFISLLHGPGDPGKTEVNPSF